MLQAKSGLRRSSPGPASFDAFLSALRRSAEHGRESLPESAAPHDAVIHAPLGFARALGLRCWGIGARSSRGQVASGVPAPREHDAEVISRCRDSLAGLCAAAGLHTPGKHQNRTAAEYGLSPKPAVRAR
jgi:hypothetical protein